MKLNHKFRLIPLDEDESRIQALESDITSLLANKKIPDFKKMAVYENLLLQMQTYKQEMRRPPVVALQKEPNTRIVTREMITSNDVKLEEDENVSTVEDKQPIELIKKPSVDRKAVRTAITQKFPLRKSERVSKPPNRFGGGKRFTIRLWP